MAYLKRSIFKSMPGRFHDGWKKNRYYDLGHFGFGPAVTIRRTTTFETIDDIVHKKISVFALVAYGFGAERWHKSYNENGRLGINEPFAYGYHRADEMGCEVSYSKDYPETFVSRYFRLFLRVLLGFDLIHALRNRNQIFSADVVWTHTESQSLAICALLKLMPGRRRPKTILQTIWLMDQFPKLFILRRIFFRFLLNEADILTFLSEENATLARTVFPNTRVEMVKFGINADNLKPPHARAIGTPLRVLSVGNDRHRDWATLKAALQGREDVTLRVVSAVLPATYLSGNCAVIKVSTNEELMGQYEWADIVVVPLKYNLHASGITVVLEATILGLPVICTDTGGLRDYFPNGEVLFVALGSKDELNLALDNFNSGSAKFFEMTKLAQDRVVQGDLSSAGFVTRHVKLSKEILFADIYSPS
jgi:glycosyltransferase involved in cell wall biosynthesis